MRAWAINAFTGLSCLPHMSLEGRFCPVASGQTSHSRLDGSRQLSSGGVRRWCGHTRRCPSIGWLPSKQPHRPQLRMTPISLKQPKAEDYFAAVAVLRCSEFNAQQLPSSCRAELRSTVVLQAYVTDDVLRSKATASSVGPSGSWCESSAVRLVDHHDLVVGARA